MDGQRGQCGDIEVPIPASWGRASPSQARPGAQRASLEARHRRSARRSGPRRPAPPRGGAFFVPASGANAGGAPRSARSLTATPLPRSTAGPLRDLPCPGRGGRREEIGHVAGLVAGLESARPGGRGSRRPPLQPAGLRKILLGQWQAGRRARIGAGALLITVETRAAGNAGGCGAGGGGSPRGGRRRCLGSEHPRVFTGGKSPSRAGGRRAGRKRGTAWGHWEARDIPKAIWLGYS